MKVIDILLLSLCAFSVVICLIISYGLLKWPEFTVIIVLLNLFFVPLLVQLKGSLPAKACVLMIGNYTGVILNVLLFNLATSIHELFGLPTSALLTIIYPILNLMWIVPFWSLTLSLLPKTAGKVQP